MYRDTYAHRHAYTHIYNIYTHMYTYTHTYLRRQLHRLPILIMKPAKTPTDAIHGLCFVEVEEGVDQLSDHIVEAWAEPPAGDDGGADFGGVEVEFLARACVCVCVCV